MVKPSLSNIGLESSSSLQRIQKDICEPIYPPSGLFNYFMVLIDASAQWSHFFFVTHNVVLARFLHRLSGCMFLDHTIKIILDNVGEFISKVFDGLLHFSQD